MTDLATRVHRMAIRADPWLRLFGRPTHGRERHLVDPARMHDFQRFRVQV
jgi:hypothetical protein